MIDEDEFDAYRRQAMKDPVYAKYWQWRQLRPVERARILRVNRGHQTNRAASGEEETMRDEPEDGTYELELVMPFVTVTSKGGPHDDQAYVCGWECGALDIRLAALALINGDTLTATVHGENLPQVDLIAMKHGYAAIQEPAEDGEAVDKTDVEQLLRMVGLK